MSRWASGRLKRGSSVTIIIKPSENIQWLRDEWLPLPSVLKHIVLQYLDETPKTYWSFKPSRPHVLYCLSCKKDRNGHCIYDEGESYQWSFELKNTQDRRLAYYINTKKPSHAVETSDK